MRQPAAAVNAPRSRLHHAARTHTHARHALLLACRLCVFTHQVRQLLHDLDMSYSAFFHFLGDSQRS
jgi:hypothetical protein